jgi:hypothetical protein
MGAVAEIAADMDRLGIGANYPPEPTPFDAIQVHVQDLVETAKGFLDGSGVTTQAEADAVSKLMDEGRKASKAADNARADEKRPHDEAGKAVQAKFKPLIESADRVVTICKQALAPFLMAQEAEKQRVAEVARAVAEAKLQAAVAAARAAHTTDLEAQEKAAELEKEASKANTLAKRAEADKAHGNGGSRAATLRTSYRPVMVDGVKAARWAWNERREECETFFLSLAVVAVREGRHGIPGFAIEEIRSVV